MYVGLMEDENYNPNHIFIFRFEEGNGVLKNCLESSPSHEEIAQVQGKHIEFRRKTN